MRRACFLTLFAGLLVSSGRYAAADSGVATVHAAAWARGDAAREGAGEFQVLLSVASVQRAHRTVGVVGVGNRLGLFSPGGEHALRFLALHGVPVVKLGQGNDVAPDPAGLYLEAGTLTETQAAALLTRCLDRYGALPAAANPDRPTTNEVAAIRDSLRPYRAAFALANAGQDRARVAARED